MGPLGVPPALRGACRTGGLRLTGLLEEAPSNSDCSNHEQVRNVIRDLVAARGSEAIFEDIHATDPMVAVALRFPGCPTVRVNGTGLEPGFDDPRDCLLCSLSSQVGRWLLIRLILDRTAPGNRLVGPLK